MSEFKFAVNESARIVFRHYEFRADREFTKVAYLKARHERIADILNGRSDYFAGIITAAEVIKELGIVAAKRLLDERDYGGPLWKGYHEFLEQKLA